MAARRGVRICAPAKINLFLHIGDKRADGFHALESLVVFAEAGDRISCAPDPALTFVAEGPFAGRLPAPDDNLILRAARALDDKRGASIRLEKCLPVASGIGGGSADAAAAMRALNLLWHLDRDHAALADLALGLGSDVPACLLSRPLWMEGRGERVSPVPSVPPVAMLLVNPGVAVPTAKIFAALEARTGTGKMAAPPVLSTLWDLEAYLEGTCNDLEEPARAFAPEIGDVLDALADEPGCVIARMSGSGATCFGLFDGRHFALRAAEAIAHDHPEWWVRATRIAAPDIGAPHWDGFLSAL